MFIGHMAVAFGAKRAAPAVSLGTMLFACQLADLIWPVLVLLAVERVAVQTGVTVVTPLDFIYYPYSHSLVPIYAANLFGPPPSDGMSAAWSALALWLLVIWGYWIDRHRQPLAARA